MSQFDNMISASPNSPAAALPFAASSEPDDTVVQMNPADDVTIRAAMDRRAVTRPESSYCTFDGRAYTFAEIDRMANRVANGLLERGLKPGDRIALMLPSHPDHIAAILGLAKAGFVRVSINVHLIGA